MPFGGVELGWITLDRKKNQRHFVFKSGARNLDVAQIPKDWFQVDPESFTTVNPKFDSLKISTYLKGIEAVASEVFPFSYDTSSHWFYYVFFNTKRNRRISIQENRQILNLLKEFSPRHGMSNAAISRGAIRHPMPNLGPEQIKILNKLRRNIATKFSRQSIVKSKRSFRKIWVMQVTDIVFRNFLIAKNGDLLTVSRHTFRDFQQETKKLVISYCIIRSLYGTIDQKISHKAFCKKTLFLLSECNTEVMAVDMKKKIIELVEESRSRSKPLWRTEANKALKQGRPVFRSYRTNAFFKVLRQLE